MVACCPLVAGVIGAVPVALVPGGWPPARPLLVVCDVGQGDGLVLPVGGGSAVVVDTGPEPTAIDGCLRRLGITDVPLLFLTHFHADHVGGITGVLDGRRVGRDPDVAVPAATGGLPGGVSPPRPRAGFRCPCRCRPGLRAGRLRLTVLGPVGRLAGTRSDPNNNSLVMRVDEAGVRMLLTGDAEIEEQDAILAADGAARCAATSEDAASRLRVPEAGVPRGGRAVWWSCRSARSTRTGFPAWRH